MVNTGKLIVIEGTDCSGKQTQTDALVNNLKDIGYKTVSFSFPMYNTPSGKIVGEAYLGQNSPSYFTEGIENVDPKISSLYYAADRAYNIKAINEYLQKGYIVIVNRYVESNMAFQGGKIKDIKERNEMYEWLDNLEFVLLDLPRPDLVIFLYLPYEEVCILKEKKGKSANLNMLRFAEIAYLELSDIYDYQKINCLNNNTLRSVEDIAKEVLNKVQIFLEGENDEVK